jgi:hypothetical protein
MENPQQCERTTDLISWLYGEAGPEEVRSFKSHLTGCVQCREDAKSFAGIRHSVIAWRDESLPSMAQFPSKALANRPTKKSALAAIRQFFDLSPLWMKGAVGFATLLLGLLLAFSVMRMRQNEVPGNATDRTYNESEISALVERRVRERVEELRAGTPPAPQHIKPTERQPSIKRNPVTLSTSEVARAKNARGPLTQEERDQLAADLRLTEPDDPELDLIEDRIIRPD